MHKKQSARNKGEEAHDAREELPGDGVVPVSGQPVNEASAAGLTSHYWGGGEVMKVGEQIGDDGDGEVKTISGSC